MDPIQFRVDWELLAEVLAVVVVLSFFVERALSVITENRLFVDSRLDDMGVKEILSFVLAMLVVKAVDFDALAVIFKLGAPGLLGTIITAAIISGGSKASIKLFHDVMNIKSSARREKDLVTGKAAPKTPAEVEFVKNRLAKAPV